jgi:hypothetical protein
VPDDPARDGTKRSIRLAYVITDACIRCKFTDSVETAVTKDRTIAYSMA